jgi:hypothetical protein
MDDTIWTIFLGGLDGKNAIGGCEIKPPNRSIQYEEILNNSCT